MKAQGLSFDIYKWLKAQGLTLTGDVPNAKMLFFVKSLKRMRILLPKRSGGPVRCAEKFLEETAKQFFRKNLKPD